MKIKKLNARGFSHELVIVGVIVLSAIIGVGYMVGSHADSCSPTKTPASGAVSLPASGLCKQTTVGCNFTGIPRTATLNQVLKNKPRLVITNYGPQKSTFKVTEYLVIYSAVGQPQSGYFSFKQTLASSHKSTHYVDKQLINGGLSNLNQTNNNVVFQAVFNQSKNVACSAYLKVIPS